MYSIINKYVHLLWPLQAEADTKQRAQALLEPPPILPVRIPRGEMIAVDENLAAANSHRIVFTDTSQHKENQVR